MSTSLTCPARVLEVDLDAPAQGLEPEHRGRTYASALVLARRAGRPAGIVAIRIPPGGLSPAELASAVSEELGAVAGPAPPPKAGGARDDVLTLSVVIPTRERPDRLAGCLGSIAESALTPDEVLVVDNSPATGATRELVADWSRSDPRVRYLVEQERGIAAARGAGLVAARSELVAFVDDDILLDQDWTRAVADAFSVADDVQAVTTLILPRALETPSQLLLERFGGFAKGLERQVFDLGANRRPDPLYPYSPGIYGSGAAMAFRAQPLRALGGPDRRLTDGGEDLDLFLQVVLAGHRLVYEPSAVAWHAHPAEYSALRRTMFVYGTGLTGLMTKWLLSDPRTAAAIARRVPAAVRLALDPRSRKNEGKGQGYPRQLTAIELAGMLVGPFMFARRALQARPRRG